MEPESRLFCLQGFERIIFENANAHIWYLIYILLEGVELLFVYERTYGIFQMMLSFPPVRISSGCVRLVEMNCSAENVRLN